MKNNSQEIIDDQIEGLDDEEENGWGDYPLDTLLIRTEQRTVFDVCRRMDLGSFVMNPDFQRDFIWPDDKQSKLIESVLMRIPLPVFYLAEDDLGRMVVVDGLQRLSTFQRFLNNELSLVLPKQPELHKKRFKDLPAKLQNRVEDCNLALYVIDAKVPERARLDIFQRVNGGVPLTRQQMRNCLYMGKATRFLKEESITPMFSYATGDSLSSKTMRDREFVNRFCAFQILSIDSYRGEMDEFLAMALKKMETMTNEDIMVLSTEFRNGLNNNFNLFGKHSFRKHLKGQTNRHPLNASLWDIMSTGLSRRSLQDVEARADIIKDKFYMLMSSELFIKSITYSPNSTKNVRFRFEVADILFKEVFDVESP